MWNANYLYWLGPSFWKALYNADYLPAAELCKWWPCLTNHCLYIIQVYLIQDLLGEDGVFLYPAYPSAAHLHGQCRFKLFNPAFMVLFNALEMPATACPTGLNSKGLPIGIQVGYTTTYCTVCVLLSPQRNEVGTTLCGGTLPFSVWWRTLGLEEEPSFHILGECDALAGVRRRVMRQAHPDAAKISESVSCCRLTVQRRPMSLLCGDSCLQVSHSPRQQFCLLGHILCTNITLFSQTNNLYTRD